MVTVVKPNKLRICIDPQDLNKAIRREHYPLRTVEEIVAEMPNAKVFSVLDANHGFWQVQIDDESSKLCTFNTPFGRYRFLRLPFGISSAPEVFQRLQRYELQVKYKPGKELYIADTLSRAYLKEHTEPLLEDELQVHVLSSYLPISTGKLNAFKTATAADEEMRLVMNCVQTGWPAEIRHVPPEVRKYWTFREELTCSDGLLHELLYRIA
ncbi:Retrovirus-related Pol polyprotein from transposon 412 [Merluccius polli]|uniref:ribonuclease H n=1 Tax=Merluccius polli TaxID=89951 RepID=A0AA47NAD3_MERPO|nr:Retrovirus-related Pol polyprotein from transposon 412 [Merluccius polli]